MTTTSFTTRSAAATALTIALALLLLVPRPGRAATLDPSESASPRARSEAPPEDARERDAATPRRPGDTAPGQEVQELRTRVDDLEERVSNLKAELHRTRSRFEERIRALEAAVTGRSPERTADVGAGEGDEPAVRGSEAEARSGEDEALDAEERRSLEEDVAAILGESEGGVGAPADGQAPASGTAQRPRDGERRFQGRTRNLQELNPEISVTGDVFGSLSENTGNPERNQFRFAEFEASFQAALDPFSQAKFFVVQEEGEFELEEGYIDWTSLPGGIGLKVGQMRLDWGKLNRWHQHALPQADRPLVHQAIWGEGGLKGLGTSFSWLPQPFLGDYNEVFVQVVNDQNDTAFSGRSFDDPVLMVHETNYWDLNRATFLEVGVSGATGVNDPLGRFRTQVYGVDWNLGWDPPARSLYRGLELKGEFIWERREEPDRVIDSVGAYTYGTVRLNRRWLAGVRGDWTELPEEPGESVWGISPYVEWWQSEWARFRIQYSHNSRLLDEPVDENRFFFQITWALGPHKHEKY